MSDQPQPLSDDIKTLQTKAAIRYLEGFSGGHDGEIPVLTDAIRTALAEIDRQAARIVELKAVNADLRQRAECLRVAKETSVHNHAVDTVRQQMIAMGIQAGPLVEMFAALRARLVAAEGALESYELFEQCAPPDVPRAQFVRECFDAWETKHAT